MSAEEQDLVVKKYLRMIEHFITDDSTITLYVLLSPLLQYSLPNFFFLGFLASSLVNSRIITSVYISFCAATAPFRPRQPHS